jgi:hypothetical protein
MIQTAIKQHAVVDLFAMYQLTEGGLSAQERAKLSCWQLTFKDWNELLELEKVLQPFLAATRLNCLPA